MNTGIIQWADNLKEALFGKDSWMGTVEVQSGPDGNLEVEVCVGEITEVTVNRTGVKAWPGGHWYNWQDEGYHLCIKFREFLAANPFPKE